MQKFLCFSVKLSLRTSRIQVTRLQHSHVHEFSNFAGIQGTNYIPTLYILQVKTVVKNFSGPVKNAVLVGVDAATAAVLGVVVINNLFSKSCKILRISNHSQRPWWSCRLVVHTQCQFLLIFQSNFIIKLRLDMSRNKTYSLPQPLYQLQDTPHQQ